MKISGKALRLGSGELIHREYFAVLRQQVEGVTKMLEDKGFDFAKARRMRNRKYNHYEGIAS
jgi:hypothetical protein